MYHQLVQKMEKRKFFWEVLPMFNWIEAQIHSSNCSCVNKEDVNFKANYDLDWCFQKDRKWIDIS